MIKTWSFSRYQQWSKCNYSITLKTPKGKTKHEAAQRGIDTHAAIEKFFLETLSIETLLSDLDIHENSKSVLIDLKDQTLRTDTRGYPEKKLWLDANMDPCIEEEDGWFQCISDLIIETRDSIAIWDFKTGKRDHNEIAHTQQLQLNMGAAAKHWPGKKFYEAFDLYLDLGSVHKTKQYTEEQLGKILNRWKLNGDRLMNDRDHRPNPGKHTCRFCTKASVCEFHVPYDD